MFLRSLAAAVRIDPGFDAQSLLTAKLHPGLSGLDRTASEDFTRRLAERLRATPGVRDVSWADVLALSERDQATRVVIPDYLPSRGEPMSLDYARVGPRYFATLRIPLLRGRSITESDRRASRPVIVVNQAMADRFWPGLDPIGRIVATQGEERTVVGIVQNGKYRDLNEEGLPFMYLPLAQDSRADVTLIVRSGAPAAEVVPVLLAAARDVGPEVPVRDIRTIESRMGVPLFPSKVAALTLGLFGVLGLLLSTIGTYGVMAHAVSRQARDIGIRMALGARPAAVVRAVLADGARLSLIGAAVGVLVTFFVSDAVRSLLYTPRPVDPLAFAGVPAILMAVALVAAGIPARRAARIDPVRALKSD